jgi:hypothetical protein
MKTPSSFPYSRIHNIPRSVKISLLPQFPHTKKPGFSILKARLEKPSLLPPERDMEHL